MIISNLFKNRSTNLLVIMCLYVFFLPFRNNISSVLGIILFLFFFIDKKVNLRTKINEIKNNRIALLSISLYLIHIIGLLYTENFKYAGLDLEIKLPLLIIPMIIFSENEINNDEIKKIYKYFTIGNIVAMILCLIFATNMYLKTKSITFFFYNDLSKFMHPSYFSLYLGFNVLIFVLQISRINKQDKKNKNTLIFLFILTTIYLIFIAFLASKGGVLTLSICLILITIREVFRRKFYIFTYFSAILILLSIIFYTNQNTTTYKRFRDAKNELIYNKTQKPEETVGSSDTRIEVWRVTIELLKNNYLIGVGTGDIKDELVKQYKKNNFTLGVQNKYNCHNQFLQFFLIFGIIGIVIFVTILILTLRKSIQTNNLLLFQFIVLISINMMMESMLESKAGVEFYAFFNALLLKNIFKSEL